MKFIFSTIAAVLMLTACTKQEKNLPPNFNYEIPDEKLIQNVNVGAYYFNYTAADWAKKYTDSPLLGEYSALNAATMAQHKTWADEGGVDFFIFNWNGAASGDPLLNNFISSGGGSKVKMAVNYNMAHLGATNASPLTGAKLNTLIKEFKDFAAKHFNKDYYYKVENRPLVLVTPLNLSTSAATSIDYTTVIPALRKSMDSIGVNLYIIGEITSGWLPPQRYGASVKVMDGVSLSNWATDVYDRSVFFPSYSDMNWKNWSDSTRVWGMDYVPVVFPGYNDKVMTPTSKIYDIERSTEFYKTYSNVAKRNMGSKRIVLVNSWNNFQVGTALEPAKKYGTTFLEQTRKNFKVN